MSIIESPDDNDDNRLAFAAVGLLGNMPKGEAPQWHELAAWRAGNLPDARAVEVLSHVANDPACFQQWLDIAEAEAWTQEEAQADSDMPEGLSENESTIGDTVGNSDAMGSRFADRDRTITDTPSMTGKVIDSLRSIFQQPLSVYGGAFATVVVVVLLVPSLQTGDEQTLQQQLNRSLDTYIESSQGYLGNPPLPRNTRSLSGLFDDISTSDVERLQFQFGMHQFNQQLMQSSGTQVSMSDDWQVWLAALPENSVDCDTATDTAHCDAAATDFQQLGQWSLMNAAACRTSSIQGHAALDEGFWSAQYALYDRIRDLPSVARSQLFSPLLPVLQQRDPESLCAIVASIAAAGQ